MRPVYTSDTLDDASIRLGVIGNPIAHSKSPQMQQAVLNADNRSCTYARILSGTEEGEFEHTLEQLVQHDFIGVNVTVPFKKKAFGAAAQADALSTLCGAANTLVRSGNEWHCHNTDGPGFERAILELSGQALQELRIVILGACGGAGSALSCQCTLSGCRHLTLVNRPRPELQELQLRLQAHAAGEIQALHFDSPQLPQVISEADLIVNATSLGLHEGDPLPLNADWLRAGQMVYDIVTHSTPLQRIAAERGCTASDGLSMLLWQGAYAYRHWFGNLPDIELMRHTLLRA